MVTLIQFILVAWYIAAIYIDDESIEIAIA